MRVIIHAIIISIHEFVTLLIKYNDEELYTHIICNNILFHQISLKKSLIDLVGIIRLCLLED